LKDYKQKHDNATSRFVSDPQAQYKLRSPLQFNAQARNFVPNRFSPKKGKNKQSGDVRYAFNNPSSYVNKLAAFGINLDLL